jgi:hypothetical protein
MTINKIAVNESVSGRHFLYLKKKQKKLQKETIIIYWKFLIQLVNMRQRFGEIIFNFVILKQEKWPK